MLARKFQSLKYKWFVLSVRAELYMLIGIQVPEQLYWCHELFKPVLVKTDRKKSCRLFQTIKRLLRSKKTSPILSDVTRSHLTVRSPTGSLNKVVTLRTFLQENVTSLRGSICSNYTHRQKKQWHMRSMVQTRNPPCLYMTQWPCRLREINKNKFFHSWFAPVTPTNSTSSSVFVLTPSLSS